MSNRRSITAAVYSSPFPGETVASSEPAQPLSVRHSGENRNSAKNKNVGWVSAFCATHHPLCSNKTPYSIFNECLAVRTRWVGSNYAPNPLYESEDIVPQPPRCLSTPACTGCGEGLPLLHLSATPEGHSNLLQLFLRQL
jgi:hypothetical protein